MSTVRSYLELSTAHLTEQTAQRIEDSVEQMLGLPFITYAKGEYGWWVHVPATDPELHMGMTDLLAALQYARSKDCAWIMFDRDVETIEDLPSYEW